MAETYLGQIILFAGDFSIWGFAACEGQILRTNENTALFSLIGIGYTHDSLDPKKYFRLPDLRGRYSLGWGTGPGLPPYSQGYDGGASQVELKEEHLPSHHHSVALPASHLPPDKDSPMKAYPATTDSDFYTYSASGSMAGNSTNRVGKGVPINIRNPFLALNYQICINGLYPRKN